MASRSRFKKKGRGLLPSPPPDLEEDELEDMLAAWELEAQESLALKGLDGRNLDSIPGDRIGEPAVFRACAILRGVSEIHRDLVCGNHRRAVMIGLWLMRAIQSSWIGQLGHDALTGRRVRRADKPSAYDMARRAGRSENEKISRTLAEQVRRENPALSRRSVADSVCRKLAAMGVERSLRTVQRYLGTVVR